MGPVETLKNPLHSPGGGEPAPVGLRADWGELSASRHRARAVGMWWVGLGRAARCRAVPASPCSSPCGCSPPPLPLANPQRFSVPSCSCSQSGGRAGFALPLPTQLSVEKNRPRRGRGQSPGVRGLLPMLAQPPPLPLPPPPFPSTQWQRCEQLSQTLVGRAFPDRDGAISAHRMRSRYRESRHL